MTEAAGPRDSDGGADATPTQRDDAVALPPPSDLRGSTRRSVPPDADPFLLELQRTRPPGDEGPPLAAPDPYGNGPTLGSDGGAPLPKPDNLACHPEDSLTPPDGALLGGIYRVLRRIGEGAMGVILLAQDEHLQRRVAIKLLRPEQVDNHSMQHRLLDEARAMARVHHPNVVEIFAFGEHATGGAGTAPYFVMQYVEGKTLDGYAHARGGPPLPLDEALGILDQVCMGVAAIHGAGVVHRDLKPSNILVGSALRVAVADLGLARKFADDELPQMSFSGTPAYVAPEVAIRRKLDPALLPRIDVYALGLIAYWLLVGRLPFEGRSVLDLFKQHAHRPPPPPSELRPELATSFDAPILAALAKNPAERTESAEAFRGALLMARDEVPLSCAPIRIVVADDNDSFRMMLTEILMLALPGAHVEGMTDGATALAEIERNPPALGVFDIEMPGLDGIALTEAVRALPRGGDYPIIVVTGTGGAADWQRLSQLGASAFLVKPFDAGQLITLARGLMGIASMDGPRSLPPIPSDRGTVPPSRGWGTRS